MVCAGPDCSCVPRVQEEHEKFVQALSIYGKSDHLAIAKFVGTRNSVQVQCCFNRTVHHCCGMSCTCDVRYAVTHRSSSLLLRRASRSK